MKKIKNQSDGESERINSGRSLCLLISRALIFNTIDTINFIFSFYGQYIYID